MIKVKIKSMKEAKSLKESYEFVTYPDWEDWDGDKACYIQDKGTDKRVAIHSSSGGWWSVGVEKPFGDDYRGVFSDDRDSRYSKSFNNYNDAKEYAKEVAGNLRFTESKFTSKSLKEWFSEKDFNKMSPEEQEQYLKDHPGSKFQPDEGGSKIDKNDKGTKGSQSKEIDKKTSKNSDKSNPEESDTLIQDYKFTDDDIDKYFNLSDMPDWKRNMYGKEYESASKFVKQLPNKSVGELLKDSPVSDEAKEKQNEYQEKLKELDLRTKFISKLKNDEEFKTTFENLQRAHKNARDEYNRANTMFDKEQAEEESNKLGKKLYNFVSSTLGEELPKGFSLDSKSTKYEKSKVDSAKHSYQVQRIEDTLKNKDINNFDKLNDKTKDLVLSFLSQRS